MSQPTMLSSELQLAIAPGPLGIGIYRNEADGSCVVSKTTTQQTPFEVGDIILRLNGVSLRGVEGGVQGWVALFQRYANLQRNVVVRRWAPASGATVAATAVPGSSGAPTNNYNKAMTTSSSSGAPSSAPIVAPQQNAASTTHQATANVNRQPTVARAPSVPKTQQVANNNNNMIHRETVTVFKPTQESKLGIGLVGTSGCIKVSSISPGYLFSTTRLKVGMIVESINTVQCSDAAHGVRLLKAAERQVTIVARHTEKTKKALKPSTYQNAKKRKAEVSKPKKAANKKQAVSKTKTAAVPKSDKNILLGIPQQVASTSTNNIGINTGNNMSPWMRMGGGQPNNPLGKVTVGGRSLLNATMNTNSDGRNNSSGNNMMSLLGSRGRMEGRPPPRPPLSATKSQLSSSSKAMTNILQQPTPSKVVNFEELPSASAAENGANNEANDDDDIPALVLRDGVNEIDSGGVMKLIPSDAEATSEKKNVLHLWIWLRESPKHEILMLFDGWVSQLIRVVSAAIIYAQENDLRLIIHGVAYAEMVDRRNVHGSNAWGAFLNRLRNFKELRKNEVTPGDVLMVMSTELLRFGSNPDAVQKMIEFIERMEINGVKCQVFTLKEAYLDQNTALMAWKKLADKKAQLSKDIGSQRIPAKQVPVDEKKEADRNVLKVRAAEIESYVRVNKALPKHVYDLIEFVHPTKMPSNRLETLRKNFVKAQDVMAGRIDSSMSSMKHVKEVISSQNVDNAFSSLKMCVYGGTNFLPKSAQDALIFCAAMFFRTSPSTISSTVGIEIKDDGSGSILCVPLHQMCVNIARLLKYHEEQRGDQQGGKIQVTIYYDEMKSRDNGCNPQFASFVDGIYKNNFDLAMASRSNRCSSHLTSYYLLNKTCESTDTDLVFSEQYGQDDEKVAIAENERRFRQWEITTEYQAEMNVERNKLAQSVREKSLVFLSLGWKKYSKEEKKFVKSILTSNGYNSDAELIDERDDDEKDSASDDDMKPAADPTSSRSF